VHGPRRAAALDTRRLPLPAAFECHQLGRSIPWLKTSSYHARVSRRPALLRVALGEHRIARWDPYRTRKRDQIDWYASQPLRRRTDAQSLTRWWQARPKRKRLAQRHWRER